MKIGAFELNTPLPELHDPHVFAILRPWIDAGAAGRTTLNLLEKTFKAEKLGKLSRPGNFFDFTRYRPITSIINGERRVSIPNTYINFARRPENNDLIFMHLLEPHSFGELYIESIVKIIQTLRIKRFCLFGSMYDTVPHTRPLAISGIGDKALIEQLSPLGVKESKYEGPTSISILINENARKLGIETITLIVHLPQYTQLEEDYNSHLRLMEVISALYNFTIDLTSLRRQAERQYRELDHQMENDPQLLRTVQYFESIYETRKRKPDEKSVKLSPEIETFLREIDKNFH
jgi:predicted ATP-grasp superfamily ATP-dependent carboligase